MHGGAKRGVDTGAHRLYRCEMNSTSATVAQPSATPPVATVTATEAARNMRSVLDRVHLGERIVIAHAGRPLAVLTKWEPGDGGGE